MRIQIYLISTLLIPILSQSLPPQTPIIGILTQTLSNTSTQKSSYIAASYVKFIQMSGAQVIPIYSFANTSDILSILTKINGVLFPGGGMDFSMDSQWTRNADTIFKYAIEQNDKGNPFPIFGTCMGHQLLSYLSSNYNDSILTRVHGDEGIVLPINISSKGYIFETFNSNQINKVTLGGGMYYFNHNWAVTMETFNNNRYLQNFWNIISTSTTYYNQKFISSIQAKKYPFYGVQFHPQKNIFQWKVYADRSLEGIQVAQIVSNRFIEIARKNGNKFQSVQQFIKYSIYNYQTKTNSSSFTEIYIFNQIPRFQEIVVL